MDVERQQDVMAVQVTRSETGFGPGRVLIAGPRDGLPVVLVHGYAASADQWRRLIPYLAETYPVYAPDLLGFGDAPAPPPPYTPARWAEQLEHLLAALPLPRAVLVGHSLGGLIVLAAAQRFPERVAGVVLIDSLGRPAPHVERVLGGPAGILVWLLRAPGIGEVIFWGLRGQRTLARALALGAYEDPARAPADTLATWLDLIHRPGAHRAYLSVVRQIETLRADCQPGEIAQPALIIWGAADRGLPVRLAHEFLQVLPQAQVAIIPDCGHVPQSERPAATAAALRPFLTGVAGGAPDRGSG